MSRRFVYLTLFAMWVPAAAACGPIQFISQVTIRAQRAVAEAELHQAGKYAPYEYYGAEAYLEQAKHRAGYGDYQTSYRYGKKAEAMAQKAVKLTKTRREEEADVGGGPARPREEGAPPDQRPPEEEAPDDRRPPVSEPPEVTP